LEQRVRARPNGKPGGRIYPDEKLTGIILRFGSLGALMCAEQRVLSPDVKCTPVAVENMESWAIVRGSAAG
jgi:hypothetical protein